MYTHILFGLQTLKVSLSVLKRTPEMLMGQIKKMHDACTVSAARWVHAYCILLTQWLQFSQA